jgi:hypothetical protein
MLSLLKSTHAFKQKFSSRLDKTTVTFKLTHITFNYGAFQISLGSRAIERQNNQVKHYVSSSLLNYYSGVLQVFRNKTQIFNCMTLLNLSIYMVFVDPHQGNNFIPSLPTTMAYNGAHRSGNNKEEHTCSPLL